MEDLNSLVIEKQPAEPVVEPVGNVLEDYYKDEIRSEALAKHRSKLINTSSDEPVKKAGFRIMSKRQRESIGQDNNKEEIVGSQPVNVSKSVSKSNLRSATMLIGGIDILSDKAVEWLTQYKCVDNDELVGARKEIYEAVGELFDEWGWELSKEFNVLVLLFTYGMAKSRNTVKKSEYEKSKSKKRDDPNIINLNNDVSKKDNSKEKEKSSFEAKKDTPKSLIALLA